MSGRGVDPDFLGLNEGVPDLEEFAMVVHGLGTAKVEEHDAAAEATQRLLVGL